MGVASPLYRPPLHRRPRLTLYLYVTREALRPTAFALLGLTAVLLTKNILGYSDLVINRGLGAAAVGQMLFFEAIPVAARMFPFAMLGISVRAWQVWLLMRSLIQFQWERRLKLNC